MVGWREKKKKQCPYRLRKPSLRIRQADRYVNICEAILGGMLDYNLSWNKHYQPQKISSQWLLWLFSTDRCNFWFVRSDWEPLNCREQLLWQRACWTISSLSAKRVNRHRVGLHAVSDQFLSQNVLSSSPEWRLLLIYIWYHNSGPLLRLYWKLCWAVDCCPSIISSDLHCNGVVLVCWNKCRRIHSGQVASPSQHNLGISVCVYSTWMFVERKPEYLEKK